MRFHWFLREWADRFWSSVDISIEFMEKNSKLAIRALVGDKHDKCEGKMKTNLQYEIFGYGLDRAGSGYRQLAGICECGNEPSGSIKCGEFLD